MMMCRQDLAAVSMPVGNGERRQLVCAHRVGNWIAPAGFIWDGASIPRAAWSISGSPFIGPHAEAGLLHDLLYSYRGKPPRSVGPALSSRKAVDLVFFRDMRRRGAGYFSAWTKYAAVRIAGGHAWRKGTPSAK